MKPRIQFLIVILLLFTLRTQAQSLSFEKTPEWVKTIDIPKNSSISKYDILSGFYETLADYQVNIDENSIYNHVVINVVSYSGITNASQLSISLDTSYQKLKIHHLYIWRKGNKIDRTKDLSIEIMNNEKNLQQGIYTGQMVAYDILTDIRKDDLIDYAYTLVGENPIFENEKYLFVPLESINPIDLVSIRVIYSKDKDYVYNCVDCDSLISTNEVDGFRQIEIQNRNVKALKSEDNIPSWTISFKYFTLSSFKSWKDVNTWAQNVFALKKDPDLQEVFDEIFTGKETTDEKIDKIINYVQDEIRYMGIEVGIGSIKPHSPDQVVKQRFGDCKDKSLLLVSLLKKIGIQEAYPALVNVALQQEIEKLGPSNEIFNHCIVTFKYNDSIYWVDPSIPVQGGDYKHLNIVDYGKALIIGKPGDTLSTMSPRKIESLADIIDEYTINSFTKPAKLKITSNRVGYEADGRRAMVEYLGTNQLAELTLKDLKLQFPIANKTAELDVSDDIQKNNFLITYNFEVDGFWQDGDKGTNVAARGLWVFRYEPQMMYQYIDVSACAERKFDYALAYPLNLNYRVIFHLPKDILIDDDYTVYDNEAFFYEEKLEQLNSNSFEINYKFRTKTNYIKAADYKKICDEKTKIAKKFPVVIYFSK